jgi:MoaA/NifB/PqqE/SkfB family radical SAM enzyme
MADPMTGLTLRWGATMKDNPEWAPVPELADISISNHCTKGCSFCYRNSKPNREFMSLEDYCFALDSLAHAELGGVFQVALGGGEPLEHPQFLEIIDATVERGIVPNFTTNGLHLTDCICQRIKNKVGAVAISISKMDELNTEAMDMLRRNAIRTNVHYVLSALNIREATAIVNGDYNARFEGVNAIVFLTYKPAGRASDRFILKAGNELTEFLQKVDDSTISRPRIGFDACFVPMLIHFTHTNKEVVDTCEGGFFSVYIDHKLNVSPCSFSGNRDQYSLKEYPFYEIWNHLFKAYRENQANRCSTECHVHNECRGCCPYFPQITTCYEHTH